MTDTIRPPMTRAEIAEARERHTSFARYHAKVDPDDMPPTVRTAVVDLPRALDTLEQALELLAWYADPDKYTPACIIYEDGQVDCIGPARIASEGGERAREFLRQVEEAGA